MISIAIAVSLALPSMLQDQREEELQRRLIELSQKLSKLRGPNTVPLGRLQDAKPKPFPDGITGKVTEYKDGYVALNIGIDAGIERGMQTDLYRGEKFLGTVTVERVYPKECVAKFKPADGRAIEKLKADELPRAADAAGEFKGKKPNRE